MGRLRDRLKEYQPEPLQKPIEEEPIETPININNRSEPTDKEKKANLQLDNPYYLHKEIIRYPVPKGCEVIELCGRPIDFAELQDYVVHKLSPKQMTAHIKFARSKTIEEIKGYAKRPNIRLGGKLIWILILAFGILVGGYIILNTDFTSFFQGLMP